MGVSAPIMVTLWDCTYHAKVHAASAFMRRCVPLLPCAEVVLLLHSQTPLGSGKDNPLIYYVEEIPSQRNDKYRLEWNNSFLLTKIHQCGRRQRVEVWLPSMMSCSVSHYSLSLIMGVSAPIMVTLWDCTYHAKVHAASAVMQRCVPLLPCAEVCAASSRSNSLGLGKDSQSINFVEEIPPIR